MPSDLQSFLTEFIKYASTFILALVVNELRARHRKHLLQIEISSTKEEAESAIETAKRQAESDAAIKADELDRKYQVYFFEQTQKNSEMLIKFEEDRARMIEERNRDTMLKAQQAHQIGELTEKVRQGELERLVLQTQISELKSRADSRHAEMDQAAAREAALNSTIGDMQRELVELRRELENCLKTQTPTLDAPAAKPDNKEAL